MDNQNTTIEQWQSFASHIEDYEKHLSVGDIAEARGAMRNAIKACPSSFVLARIKHAYDEIRPIPRFNLWEFMSNAFGRRRATETAN